MKFDREYIMNHWGPYTIATCSAVLLYCVLTHLHVFYAAFKTFMHVISPVFLGMIMAYVLNPVERLYERLLSRWIRSPRWRRWLSVALVIITAVLLIAVLSTMFFPQVFNSMVYLGQHLQVYIEQTTDFFRRVNEMLTFVDIDITQLSNYMTEIVNFVTGFFNDNLSVILKTSYRFGANVINIIISFFIAIYIMAGKDHLIQGTKNLLWVSMSDERYQQLMSFLSRCHKILIRFIICDIIDGIIVGILNGVFMSIIGMHYIQLISVVVGVTNLAPTFGPIVGGLIGAFILVLVNPIHALIFIIFTLVLQTIDGYILKPRLFGDSLGVPSVWILIAIVVGGRLFGVMGILMGIPVAGIVNFTYHDLIWPKLQARKEKEKLEDKAIE